MSRASNRDFYPERLAAGSIGVAVNIGTRAALGLVLLQSAMLISVAGQKWRRAGREEPTSDNEERIATAALPENMALWRWCAGSEQFYAIERFRSIIGLPPTAALSRNAVRECIHPHDRENFDRLFAGASSADDVGEVVDSGFRIVAPEGEIRWLATRARVWRDASGNPLRASGVIIDMTDCKRTEAENERQQQQLAHLTRVAILGQLSGALAHELNQPLTAILSNAQTAQHFLAQDPVDLSEVRAIVQDIVNDDKRAGEVIRRLRAMLRRGGTQIQRLDLTQVTQEALALVHTNLLARKVNVHIRTAPDLPAVGADRVQIQQVFLNLLLNASEAMSGNAAHDRLIDIIAMSEGAMVHVKVIDCGVGIPDAQLESVFDAFHTTKPDGLGLGLAISRSIISAHGGKLWATGNEGRRGACFHFTLPALDSAVSSSVKSTRGNWTLGQYGPAQTTRRLTDKPLS
jgi:PAS domain S-box-containing protein